MKLAVSQLNGVRELHQTLVFSFSVLSEIVFSLSAFSWLCYNVFQVAAVEEYDTVIYGFFLLYFYFKEVVLQPAEKYQCLWLICKVIFDVSHENAK